MTAHHLIFGGIRNLPLEEDECDAPLAHDNP